MHQSRCARMYVRMYILYIQFSVFFVNHTLQEIMYFLIMTKLGNVCGKDTIKMVILLRTPETFLLRIGLHLSKNK